jgi:hypothetical protein
MKKTAVLIVSVAVLLSTVFYYKPVNAATHNVVGGTNGPNCNSGGYFTPPVTPITAGDTITFSVPANDPYSGGLTIHNFPGGDFTVLPGGTHTTDALLVDVSYNATWPAPPYCLKGSGTVTISHPAPPPPAPAPTPPPPVPTPSPTPPPPQPSQPNKPPAALALNQVAVEGDKIDTSKPVSVDKSKPITLSGYTVANGEINLTIHSLVRNEIARANASGLWTYTVSDLDPGNHEIDATVTDPATHLTSAPATLLKFVVTGAAAAVNPVNKVQAKTVTKKNNSRPIAAAVLAILILAAVGGAVFWILKHRKPPTKPKDQKVLAPPPSQIAPSV